MAWQAKRFQANHDKQQAKLSKLEPEYTALKQKWDSLEEAWQGGSVEGVVNRLMNDSNGFEKYVQAYIQKQEARRNATPEQLEAMELREQMEAVKRELAQSKKSAEDTLKTAEQRRQEAAQEKVQAQLSPAAEKYSFAGRLGDAEAEDFYDGAVWRAAIDTLETLDDGVELTQEIIDKAFRQAALRASRGLKVATDKQLKHADNKRKQVAQTNAAVAGVRGNKDTGKADGFRNKLKNGDTFGAFKDFFGM
jgi:hypothetical protein